MPRIISNIVGGNLGSDIILDYYLCGVIPRWVSSNTINISTGSLIDGTNQYYINVPEYITLNLNTTGVNGLDVGVPTPDTWYYIWVAQNLVNKEVSAFISLSYQSPTIPEEYVYKRRLPFALRTNSNTQILKFHILNWGLIPTINWDIDDSTVFLGNAPSTFTNVSLQDFLPPPSTKGIIFFSINEVSNKILQILHPEDSSTHSLPSFGSPTQHIISVSTDAQQQISIRGVSSTLLPISNLNCAISVQGFVINQV